MKKTGMKIFAYLAVMLMLVSVLPAGALAAEDDSQANDAEVLMKHSIETQERIRVMENATEDRARVDGARVQAAVQTRAENVQVAAVRNKATRMKLEKARNEYTLAKDNFQKIRANVNNKNVSADSEEALEAARSYMIRTIDYMISHLENVQENVESADGEFAEETSEVLEGYITQLEQEKENVEAAETRKELADAAKSVRGIWRDAQTDAKFRAGTAANNRINQFLVKSEVLAQRLENEIERLKAEGKDTAELEEMLDEYNELIEQANENQICARERFRNGNGPSDASVKEANQCLREAGKDIRKANHILKDIFKELKEHRRGAATLDGTGTLTAEGDGTAVLSGDLIVNITATNAKLVIKDLGGDANISIDGDYTEVETCDDECSARVYHNFTGTMDISGSRLTIMIRGEDVSITAEGTGSAILSGTGIYRVDKAGGSSENVQWAVTVTSPTGDSDENDSEDREVAAETEDNEGITDANQTDANQTGDDGAFTDGNQTGDDGALTDGNQTGDDEAFTDGNQTEDDGTSTGGNETEVNTMGVE